MFVYIFQQALVFLGDTVLKIILGGKALKENEIQ